MKALGSVILLCCLCGLSFSDDCLNWLSWSAKPEHFQFGKAKLPKGAIALYHKEEPLGILFLEEGKWLVLSTGEEYDFKGNIEKYNPKKGKNDAKPGVKEVDEIKENYGVIWEKLGEEESIYYNGDIITKNTAMMLLSNTPYANDIPNDRDSYYFTVIGDEPQIAQVKNDIVNDPGFIPLKKKSIIKYFPRDHWRIVDGGFYNKGNPTIYLQDKTGKVLWRQDNYDGGKVALLAALRDRVPDYDPNKDPQPRPTPAPTPTPIVPDSPDIWSSFWKNLPQLVFAAAVVFFVYLYFRRGRD